MRFLSSATWVISPTVKFARWSFSKQSATASIRSSSNVPNPSSKKKKSMGFNAFALICFERASAKESETINVSPPESPATGLRAPPEKLSVTKKFPSYTSPYRPPVSSSTRVSASSAISFRYSSAINSINLPAFTSSVSLPSKSRSRETVSILWFIIHLSSKFFKSFLCLTDNSSYFFLNSSNKSHFSRFFSKNSS